MIKYPRVSEEYINSKLNPNIKGTLLDVCYNLSAILTDVDGKITQSASKNMLKSLDITAPGIIILGESAPEVTVPGDIPGYSYDNTVSSPGYALYELLKSGSDTVVFYNDTIVSPLLTLSSLLLPSIKNSICSIHLDSFAVYTECLNAIPSVGLKSISQQDLTRIDNNIRWVTQYLEYSDSQEYELISILRDLQRTILHLRSIDSLFIKTYRNRIQELKEWRGISNG